MLGLAVLLTGCLSSLFDGSRTFEEDVRLLLRRADAQVLRSPQSDACVVVTAAYQGRVMTSAFGPDEPGFGWIDRDLVRSDAESAKAYSRGGEDALVIGPTAGPFALRPGPAEPFAVVRKSDREALFRRDAEFANLVGTVFRVRIERRVGILGDSAELNQTLQSVVPVHVRSVGYRTESTLVNRGAAGWTPEGGLLSVRSQGRWRGAPALRIVVPFQRGSDDELGPVITAEDLGKIGPGRLRVADGFLVFRGDGRARERFGVGSRRALAVLGVWDPVREVLTVVRFSRPAAPPGFADASGDVIEVRGDTGFCELTIGSPALGLAPGASATHRQAIVHLNGPRRELDVIARNTLGVGLDEIEAALP